MSKTESNKPMRCEFIVQFNATHCMKTTPPILTVLNYVRVRERAERLTVTTIAELIPLPVAMATYSLRQMYLNTYCYASVLPIDCGNKVLVTLTELSEFWDHQHGPQLRLT